MTRAEPAIRLARGALWIAPAAALAVALARAPTATRPRPGPAPGASGWRARRASGFSPGFARAVFDALRAPAGTDPGCTFGGISTEAARLSARWERNGQALDPAEITWSAPGAPVDQPLVVRVPDALRTACPRAAAAVEHVPSDPRIWRDAALPDTPARVILPPWVSRDATLTLPRARWLWLAIALAATACAQAVFRRTRAVGR